MKTIADLAGVNVDLLKRSLNEQSIRALQAMDQQMLIATVGTILKMIQVTFLHAFCNKKHDCQDKSEHALSTERVENPHQEATVSSSNIAVE